MLTGLASWEVLIALDMWRQNLLASSRFRHACSRNMHESIIRAVMSQLDPVSEASLRS